MEINSYLLQLFQVVKDSSSKNLFEGATSALSKTEFRLLREVVYEQEKGKEIISSELARRLGITRSAISQIVGKLEERGIVERASSPTDRKIAYVRLSERSRAFYENQCRRVNAIMELVEQDLGAEKLEGLISSLRDLSDAINRAKQKVEAKESASAHEKE